MFFLVPSSLKCSQKSDSSPRTCPPLPSLTCRCVCVHKRDASIVKHLEEKLSAARQLLAQQKAQELSVQKEHRKADTHKKMTEF